ncbi:MAG: enoyl-CoA hydratase [Candidatus Dormibacteria bacterium]
MTWDTVLYEKHGNIARVILNRPEKRNALDDRLIEEVHEALYEADLDDSIRVTILSGAGPQFSAGHDMGGPEPVRYAGGRPAVDREMQFETGGVEGLLRRERHIYLEKSLLHRNLMKPTIAQVHGWCVAGGLMLACMCDLIVASTDAQFSNPVLRMTNGGVELLVEPWELGARKAKEFLWTGDSIDAHEAWRLGLVNRVVERAALDEETMKLARRIALTPPAAVQTIKRSINQAMDLMGQRASWEYHFANHNLAHWTDESNAIGAELAAEYERTGSVIGFVHKRDKRYASDEPGTDE